MWSVCAGDECHSVTACSCARFHARMPACGGPGSRQFQPHHAALELESDNSAHGPRVRLLIVHEFGVRRDTGTALLGARQEETSRGHSFGCLFNFARSNLRQERLGIVDFAPQRWLCDSPYPRPGKTLRGVTSVHEQTPLQGPSHHDNVLERRPRPLLQGGVGRTGRIEDYRMSGAKAATPKSALLEQGLAGSQELIRAQKVPRRAACGDIKVSQEFGNIAVR
jgi:hypothetical protein